MPASGKVLEDSIRLSRIRRIRLTLYTVQAVMLVALAFLMIVAFGHATYKPYLYIPFDSFIVVLILLLLIISLESFFFRILDVRFARSSSARHLMAKNSIKRSLVLAIISGVVTAIFMIPSIMENIETSSNDTFDVSPNEYPPYFYSSDTFAFTKPMYVEITAPSQVQVYLVSVDMFEIYYSGPDSLSDMYYYRLNREDFTTFNNALTIEVPHTERFTRFYLVLNDMDNPGTSATMTVVNEVSGVFTNIGAPLLLALVVANIAWIAYLIPIERKYSASSIYK